MTESFRYAPTGSKDPQFGAPAIDVDEWRDEPVRRVAPEDHEIERELRLFAESHWP